MRRRTTTGIASNNPNRRLRHSRVYSSVPNAACWRVTSARCAERFALLSSSISWAIASTASRRGSTSRRRKLALLLIFSTMVQSKSGSNPSQ